MFILLNGKDLFNTQQMEVAIRGPDGATHLILCTGMADLAPIRRGAYIFPVGPHLSRRQFVAVIASGAIATIRAQQKSVGGPADEASLDARLLSIEAGFDEETCQVMVMTEVLCGAFTTGLVLSYNVSILAELQGY